MKKITKCLSLICAIVMVLIGSVLFTGCFQEKETVSKTFLENMSITVKDFEDNVFNPAKETLSTIKLADSGEHGGSDLPDELNFLDSRSLISIIKELKDLESGFITKVDENKYTMEDTEITLLDSNKLQIISTDVEIVDEGTEWEEVQNTTTTRVYSFDKTNKFFRIDFYIIQDDGESNVSYESSEVVEVKVTNDLLYAQRYKIIKYYENGEIEEERKNLYEVKSNFELVSNSQIQVNSVVVACPNNVVSFNSIKERDLTNFATTNLEIDWSAE